MKFRFIACLLLCFSTVAAVAQVGVYGEFSTATLNVVYTNRIYGSTFGVYYDKKLLPFVSAGVDARGSFLGSGSPSVDSGLFGPRLAFRLHRIPLQPYAEVLIGVGHAKYGEGSALTIGTGFESQFLGGLDVTLLPHIDWRAVEFSYGELNGLVAESGSDLHPETISTGMVVRLR